MLIIKNGLSVPPRIAIYSQDGLGLGHMRRTSSIAARFLELCPDAAVLTLSDSKLGQFFPTSQNHDYLKLPSIVKFGQGNWRASNLPLDFSDVLELRRTLIHTALLSFAPDIFLVDHMPHGAMGELIPGLEAIRSAGLPSRIVLGLRDILDDPQVIQRRWQEEGAYEALDRFYDRVLIYGMREVFDVAEKYRFPEKTVLQTRFCGYVCTPEAARSTERLRTRYLAGCVADTKLIVGMAGGGADAYPMMSALLDAFPLVQEQQRSVLVLVTGPFLPKEEQASLQRRARRSPVRVLESVEDTLSYLSAADVVVTMAGYNTTAEIMRLKKPAILIPRPGPSAEQRTRARLFAARHWVDEVDPDVLTPARLAERILHLLAHPTEWPVINRPDLHGLTVTVYQLLGMLSNHPEEPPLPDPAGLQQAYYEAVK